MISAMNFRKLFHLALFMFVALVVAGRANGQRGSQFAKAAAKLPAESRAVVERLSALHELPDGVWKMHSGDLAHGEAVGLDESSWEPEQVGFKAPNDAVWFRQTFVVVWTALLAAHRARDFP